MCFVVLPLFLLAAACAADGGEWPSLTHRPGEPAAETPCGKTPSAAVVAKVQPAVPTGTVVDLDSLERRLAEATAAWATQQGRTEAATGNAKNAGAGDTRWATAQLELSRLEQKGAAFRDIEDALSGVVTPTERSGTLLASVRRALEKHVKAFDSLRKNLAR